METTGLNIPKFGATPTDPLTPAGEEALAAAMEAEAAKLVAESELASDTAVDLDKAVFTGADEAVTYDPASISTNHENVFDGPGYEDEVAVEEPIVRVDYKHKTIATFQVGNEPLIEVDGMQVDGRFYFSNHILTIQGPESIVRRRNALFLKFYEGLLGVDKVNIKKLRNIENEVSPDVDIVPTAVRGMVGTQKIADRPAGDRLAPVAKPAAPTFKLPFQNGRAAG